MHKISALKYRPNNFSDVIGQEHLITVISNSITLKRIPNAFLLTGPHGVGKTTIARIVAKSINCKDRIPDSAEPCNKCLNCQMITASEHPDVIEMDAASHTSVDNIRNILETTQYLPLKNQYKVFIIDEVHMLSNSAFNALLKTLEEPPEHIKFIFATTEINKIPVTITSRCQHMNLNRLSSDTIKAHLQEVASQENIKFEKEAMEIIANLAQGSIRDSLSIFDSILVYDNAYISSKTVQNVFGMTSKDNISQLGYLIITGESKKSLQLFNTLYQAGSDPVLTLQSLLRLFYALSKELINAGDSKDIYINMRLFTPIIKKISIATINYLWQILIKGLQEIKLSPETNIACEMVIIRLCYAANLPPLKKIITNSQLQKNIQNLDKTSVNSNKPSITNANEILELLQQNDQLLLYEYFYTHCELTKIEEWCIYIIAAPGIPSDFGRNLQSFLNDQLEANYKVNVSLNDDLKSNKEKTLTLLKEDENVKELLDVFPEAEIIEVKQ